MWRLTLGIAAFLLPSAWAQSISGRVVDSSTGEPLARVVVQVEDTKGITGRDGRFAFQTLPPGEHVLRVSTIGYRPVHQPFRLEDQEPKAFDISLFPDTLRHRETVNVEAGVFAQESPAAVGLIGNELKNLASVLADDPLRAVQSLPGVTSNDDFQGQYAVRGAGFNRTGVYLDSVLLHNPFHSVQGDSTSASLTILNGDSLDSLNLHAGPLPPAFGDRTAGALDVRTRDGDANRLSFRVTASASNLGAIAEGPLGKHGSWLAGARKSYLEYIISRTSDEPGLAFGFSDAQGKVAYDLTPRHQVSLSVIDGRSGLDRTEAIPRLGVNSVVFSNYHFTLANLGWRYSPSGRFLLTNRGAFLRERYENENRARLPLAASGYGEWVWQVDGTRSWGESGALQFGGGVRRLRDDGYELRLQTGTLPPVPVNLYRGSGPRSGFYLHQTWAPARRMEFTAGGRWDRHETSAQSVLSPYASMAVSLWPSARLHAGWGQAAQFPEINQFWSILGRRSLLPERATHYQVSIEQRFGDRTRVRVEAYNRDDRDLLFRPLFDPRFIGNRVFNPPLLPPWENSQRGYARGLQIFLQRRTANGFAGWISYTYGVARVRDGVTNVRFPADFDQRHTVNFFGTYRIRPTVNVSGKWIYGSGLPLRGFFEQRGQDLFLSHQRNALRLPSYQRTDLRVNKVFLKGRRRLTLFAEVINLFNRDNVRFDDYGSYDSRTGRTRVSLDKTFPILPSAGIVLEF